MLIKLKEKDSLTCSECFAFFELLPPAAKLGAGLYHLKKLARQHLELCPDCQEEKWQQLPKLEELGA